MAKRELTAALLSACLLAPPAFASRAAGEIADFAVIEDGEGHGRILVHWNPAIAAEHFVIQRAVMQFNLAGEPEERTIRLNVHPVTRAWNANGASWSGGWTNPGGDFDPESSSRAVIDVGGQAGPVVIDVTNVVKDVFEHGIAWNGMIVTVDPAEGIGLSAEDLSRFEGLSSATVELTGEE